MKLSPLLLVPGLLLACSSCTRVPKTPDAGQLESEAYMIDRGLEDGLWGTWYETGPMQARGRFEGGKARGLWIHWDENGQLSGEREWKKGRHDGRWGDWYENGAMKSVGALKNGKRDGLWTFWHEQGSQQATGEFVLDRREGAWKFWDEDGDIEAEGMFVDGQRVGHWYFAPEGLKDSQDVVRARAASLLQLLAAGDWGMAADFVLLDENTRQRMGLPHGASEEDLREQLASWFEKLYRNVRPGSVRSVRIDPKDPEFADVSYRAGDLDGFQMRLADGEWYYTLE